MNVWTKVRGVEHKSYCVTSFEEDPKKMLQGKGKILLSIKKIMIIVYVKINYINSVNHFAKICQVTLSVHGSKRMKGGFERLGAGRKIGGVP